MQPAALIQSPRTVLELADLSAVEFDALLELASTMHHHPLAWRHTLEGRAVGCVIHACTPAPHVMLATVVNRLGALPVVVDPSPDAREDGYELSASCDAIAVDGASQRWLRDVVEVASVPVLNVRGREHDLCGALACCLVLRERFGTLDGLSVAFIGPAEAVAHSLLQAAPLTRLQLRLACPEHALADPWMIASAGRSVRVFDAPEPALAGAHAVVTEASRSGRAAAAQALLYVLVTGNWERSP